MYLSQSPHLSGSKSLPATKSSSKRGLYSFTTAALSGLRTSGRRTAMHAADLARTSVSVADRSASSPYNGWVHLSLSAELTALTFVWQLFTTPVWPAHAVSEADRSACSHQ